MKRVLDVSTAGEIAWEARLKINSGVSWKTVETKRLNFRSVIAGERGEGGEPLHRVWVVASSSPFLSPISKPRDAEGPGTSQQPIITYLRTEQNWQNVCAQIQHALRQSSHAPRSQ